MLVERQENFDELHVGHIVIPQNFRKTAFAGCLAVFDCQAEHNRWVWHERGMGVGRTLQSRNAEL